MTNLAIAKVQSMCMTSINNLREKVTGKVAYYTCGTQILRRMWKYREICGTPTSKKN